MVEIRPAVPADMPRVLELIKELAIYEKEPQAVTITSKDLQEAGYGQQPQFHCFVGLYDGVIQGMALCYPRFSTWKGTTLHLEDLIVSADYREKGLGSRLYRRVLEHARDLGVKRAEWVVLDWNKNAVAFYKSSGATILEDWHLVQMDDTAMANYLGDEAL